MEKIIGRGAEALLIQKENYLIKRRISKSYRLPILDEKLRKSRTKAEAKIMQKLEKSISVPKILRVDEKSKEITMQFISGKKLSEHLDSFSLKKQEAICSEIGKEVAKIHNLDIIHGDLTTSNMILVDSKIYLIDFGLGFHSCKIEDKAVDIHLFKQALESKHFQNWERLFSAFIKSYNSKDKDKILKQLEKVEARGRYK